MNVKSKENFVLKRLKSTNPVAVGDRVEFTVQPSNNNEKEQNIGLITDIEERKNYIIRRSQNLSKQSHIIAANIDQAVLVVTLNYPVTTTTFIDRYLASAEAYRIPVLLVFNKTDRYDRQSMKQMEKLMNIVSKNRLSMYCNFSKECDGIEEFKRCLKRKTNVFNGHSGVGKSTLINILEPGLKLKTMDISDAHNTGKHTTTFSALYKLHFGGYIIDTPGIKAFGMLEMEPWEISHYFPEIFKISANCQYKNCSHTHEPGCAVKQAVKKDEIAQSRFISYLGFLKRMINIGLHIKIIFF